VELTLAESSKGNTLDKCKQAFQEEAREILDVESAVLVPN
jgi:hypothetical protein